MSFSINSKVATADDLAVRESKVLTSGTKAINYRKIITVENQTHYDTRDDNSTQPSDRHISRRLDEHIRHRTPSPMVPVSLIGTVSGIVIELDSDNDKAIVEFGIEGNTIFREMSYKHVFELSRGKIAPGHGLALYTHKLDESTHLSTFVYLGDQTNTIDTDELEELEKRYRLLKRRNT